MGGNGRVAGGGGWAVRSGGRDVVLLAAQPEPAGDRGGIGVSQSTVSRLVTALAEPIAAVCDRKLPELRAGRVVLVDGALVPTGNRTGHRQLYSSRRRRAGVTVSGAGHTGGGLWYVGAPQAGSTHDVTAFCDTGLADVLADQMANNLVIADLGYLGEPVLTPARKPPGGVLSCGQKEANWHLSGIRAAVERAIAHLKNWKILATGYRRPLRTLSTCLAAVTALEFYRLNQIEF